MCVDLLQSWDDDHILSSNLCWLDIRSSSKINAIETSEAASTASAMGVHFIEVINNDVSLTL